MKQIPTMPVPQLYENASALFLDIVGYPKQSVDQQAKLVSLLQAAVNLTQPAPMYAPEWLNHALNAFLQAEGAGSLSLDFVAQAFE
jgi:hypothetical protein